MRVCSTTLGVSASFFKLVDTKSSKSCSMLVQMPADVRNCSLVSFLQNDKSKEMDDLQDLFKVMSQDPLLDKWPEEWTLSSTKKKFGSREARL